MSKPVIVDFCRYSFVSGKNRDFGCSRKITLKDPEKKFCCVHYKQRSRRNDDRTGGDRSVDPNRMEDDQTDEKEQETITIPKPPTLDEIEAAEREERYFQRWEKEKLANLEEGRYRTWRMVQMKKEALGLLR